MITYTLDIQAQGSGTQAPIASSITHSEGPSPFFKVMPMKMVLGLTVMPLMQQGTGSTLVRWTPTIQQRGLATARRISIVTTSQG